MGRKEPVLGLSLETLVLQYRLREEEEGFAMYPEGKGLQRFLQRLLGVVGSRGTKTRLAGRIITDRA